MDIKKVIKDSGFTLGEVASQMKKPNGEIGLPQSALSQLIINGNPTFDKLQEIADIIGVSVSELVRNDENRVNGYIEVKGELRKVTSVQELEKIVQDLKKDRE